MLTIHFQATVLEVDRLLTGTLRSNLVVFSSYSSCHCKSNAPRLTFLFYTSLQLWAFISYLCLVLLPWHKCKSNIHLFIWDKKLSKTCSRCWGGRKCVETPSHIGHPLLSERNKRSSCLEQWTCPSSARSPKDSFSPLALLRLLLSALARECFY